MAMGGDGFGRWGADVGAARVSSGGRKRGRAKTRTRKGRGFRERCRNVAGQTSMGMRRARTGLACSPWRASLPGRRFTGCGGIKEGLA